MRKLRLLASLRAAIRRNPVPEQVVKHSDHAETPALPGFLLTSAAMNLIGVRFRSEISELVIDGWLTRRLEGGLQIIDIAAEEFQPQLPEGKDRVSMRQEVLRLEKLLIS